MNTRLRVTGLINIPLLQGEEGIGIQGIQGPRGEPGEKVDHNEIKKEKYLLLFI